MRFRALLVAALLALALAGCGSDDDLAPQVPGPPADVTIPDAGVSPSGDASQDSGDSTDESTQDPNAEETPTATAQPEGTGDTGTTTPDTSGGTAAPEAQAPAEDGPTNDTAPPEGSNAQQFEDFCAQNPGAC
jgi:hypothetical protein